MLSKSHITSSKWGINHGGEVRRWARWTVFCSQFAVQILNLTKHVEIYECVAPGKRRFLDLTPCDLANKICGSQYQSFLPNYCNRRRCILEAWNCKLEMLTNERGEWNLLELCCPCKLQPGTHFPNISLNLRAHLKSLRKSLISTSRSLRYLRSCIEGCISLQILNLYRHL